MMKSAAKPKLALVWSRDAQDGKPTDEMIANRDMVVRAALASSIDRLEPEEQYIMARVVQSLYSRSATPPGEQSIALSVPMYARVIGVRADVARGSLNAGAALLFRRTFSAACDWVDGCIETRGCWFQGRGERDDEITIHLSGIAEFYLSESIGPEDADMAMSPGMITDLLSRPLRSQ